MLGKGLVKYGLGAAIILAVALGVLFYLTHRAEPEKTVNQESNTNQTPQTAPAQKIVEDVVVAEIDGVMTKVRLPSGERQSIPGFKEFVPVEIARDAYTGLDLASLKPGLSLPWFQEEIGKNLYGNAVTVDGQDVSPVYVCDTEQHLCKKSGPAIHHGIAIIPSGAVSATGQYIAMIDQHDRPNIETGVRWELLIYRADQLEAPAWTVDISSAIDRGEEAGYDSVSSVAWSPNEERVAVASSRKIVIVDIRSGGETTVFESPAPADDEGDVVWDNGTLVWSPSGRYVAFASYSDFSDASEETDEEAADTLTIIDLEQGNTVIPLIQGQSVRLAGNLSRE